MSQSFICPNCITACGQALIWGPNGVGGDYVSASTWDSTNTPQKAKVNDRTGTWKYSSASKFGNYLAVNILKLIYL